MGSDHAESESTRRAVGCSATTHWSVVLEVGWHDFSRAAAALEKLCRTYFQPPYSYVRRRGYVREDAQDLTQGFWLQLLERH